MKLWALVALVACAIAFTAFPAAADAATSTTSVRYGPYTIPAATDAGPGVVKNKLSFAVRRPCLTCYITSFAPELVYPDGTAATMESGAMLHHAVLTSQFRRDATCGRTLLGLAGERFFASGDERTRIAFPPGTATAFCCTTPGTCSST